MPYQWSFGFLLRYTHLFVVGVEVTLAYTAGTIALGLLLGLLIGLGRLSRARLVNAPLLAIVEAFRCTPLLVQIVWFYYALPVILGIQIPAVVAATLVLSLYTAAFYAEIVRGGVQGIERGQWDAARALGLRPWAMMRLVILPQAVRRMVPPFLNQSIISRTPRSCPPSPCRTCCTRARWSPTTPTARSKPTRRWRSSISRCCSP
jgi:polar amino acid transport system permease protein